MSLSIYLNTLEAGLSSKNNWKKNTIGATITHYTDESKLVNYDIAILGVMEQRGHIDNDGCG